MLVTSEASWQALESLGLTIGRPPRRRDAHGRWQRADGGDWDWYYALPDGEREYVRRWFTSADGAPIDAVAAAAGFDDVEAWAHEWLQAIRMTKPERGAWESWERGDYTGGMAPTPGTLVGPAEVADLLGVRLATVHQWVARQLLPAPWDVVSGTRLWPRHEILAWAEKTGRLPGDGEIPAF